MIFSQFKHLKSFVEKRLERGKESVCVRFKCCWCRSVSNAKPMFDLLRMTLFQYNIINSDFLLSEKLRYIEKTPREVEKHFFLAIYIQESKFTQFRSLFLYPVPDASIKY